MWPGEVFYLPDPCELTFANTLLLSNAAISLGNAFINLEISSQFYIFFTLISFSLSSLFISLQIKEFRIMALSINDSLYSCLFFFLTGLHFFHLTIGLLLLSLLFWYSICIGNIFNLWMHFLGFNVMPRRIPSFPDTFHSLGLKPSMKGIPGTLSHGCTSRSNQSSVASHSLWRVNLTWRRIPHS